MEPKVVEQRAALARREDPDDLLAPAIEPARAEKRLFGRPRKIRRPSWCSSLSQEQWVEFRGALVEALADTGEPYPPDDDPQSVSITANDGRPLQIAVPTLIDMVTYLPSTQWTSEIAGVLDLERRATEAARRKSFARGAEGVRPVTCPLLLHADQVPDIPGLLTRSHGADLVALLEVRANRQRHFVHESDLAGHRRSRRHAHHHGERQAHRRRRPVPRERAAALIRRR